MWALLFAGALAMTILFLMVGGHTLTPQYTLHAYFKDVMGLAENASVRLDGMEVGWVKEIRFGPRDEAGQSNPEKNFEVEVRIRKEFQSEIRSDSVATLITEGLLGARYVSLTRGSSGHVLDDGGLLRSAEAKVLRFDEFLVRLSKVTKCLNESEHEILKQGEDKLSQEIKED
ncbi:MAG: MlaD family protein [Candidatus Acidiferrales bacterium]